MDFDQMADGVFKAVQGHIEKAIAPLQARIKELETAQPAKGSDGVSVTTAMIDNEGQLVITLSNGSTQKCGKVIAKDPDPVEVTLEDIRLAIKPEPEFMREMVSDYLAENPPVVEKGADGKDGIDGKNGADGKDGRDGIDGEPGKDGKDGVDGKDGTDGKDGRDADPVEVTEEDIIRALKADPAFMRSIVADYLKDNPPQPGKDGRDGRDGIDGEKGADGKDGVGLTGAMIDKNNELIVTLSDGKLQRCGVAVGRDGKDGKDGKDGVDLTDVDFEYDGERCISVKAKDGQVVKHYEMPIVIDRGYWRDGLTAKAGEAYTHDGSLWIAQKQTAAKPSTQAKGEWRLAVRKGRDGKAGKDGRLLEEKPVSLPSVGDK